MFYIFPSETGEFLTKFEFTDAEKIKNRELWLIIWSMFLGLDVGIITEGAMEKVRTRTAFKKNNG